MQSRHLISPVASAVVSPLASAIALVVCGAGCSDSDALDVDPDPDALRAVAVPLTSDAADASGYDPLVELIGDDRVVLLGDATHGTDELYRRRAALSLRLIQERGFDAVAFEADWTAMARVDAYARGVGSDASAVEALSDMQRFPRWMWRNEPFAAFVEAVRAYNQGRSPADQVRLFGLDLYSPAESAAAVVRFLEPLDPAAAQAARASYACLDQAMAAPLALEDESCARAMDAPLAAVQAQADAPGAFEALQNARVTVDAELYYRLDATDAIASWNQRDQHMVSTLAAIEDELGPERGTARQIVWAHNSHVGDARATSVMDVGETNVGQLARERWHEDVTNVGFTTYAGTVRAALAWGEPDQVFEIQPGRSDSIEGVFHDVGLPQFLLITSREGVGDALPPMRERAIGVIYSPSNELQSHYFHADAPSQFDALIHVDTTTAITPLPGAGATRTRR